MTNACPEAALDGDVALADAELPETALEETLDVESPKADSL